MLPSKFRSHFAIRRSCVKSFNEFKDQIIKILLTIKKPACLMYNGFSEYRFKNSGLLFAMPYCNILRRASLQ